LADVPTIAELGYDDYEIDVWWGLFSPANTPTETVSQLASWIGAALEAPEIRPKLATQGFRAVGICGSNFGRLTQFERRSLH
jgi:tripartite-type tricarboxylate transporter receptor subunit TctC